MKASNAFWTSGSFAALYAILLDEVGAELWKQAITFLVFWAVAFITLCPQKDTHND